MGTNIRLLQNSFTGGEISPRLLARTDLSAYKSAVKTLKNVVPMVHGGAIRRPGTVFVGEVSDSSKPAKLLKMTQSRDVSYILVFNNGKIQFVHDGAFVESGGNRVEVAIPYGDNDYDLIQYAQYGSIMYLVHPNYPVYQLQQINTTTWNLTTVDFVHRAVSDQWFENAYLRFKLLPTGDGFKVNDHYRVITDGTGGITSQSWLVKTGTGSISEVVVDIENDIANAPTVIWDIVCVSANTKRQEFTVEGDVIDNTIDVAGWSAVNGYPNSISFFQQRLYFGANHKYPQHIWGSAVGAYEDLTTGPDDADAVTFQIASNNFDEIALLENARSLLALSYGAEFSVTGNSSAGITPSSAKILAHTFHGSRSIKPIRIGQEVLFCQRDGKKIRGIHYDVTQDTNLAPDLTLLAEHITGDGVIDMSFAQAPEGIAWMVRGDGNLISLTHDRDQIITAWAQHDTDGLFQSVCTIPENNNDNTYFIVERTINGVTKKYLELMSFDTYMDCALHGEVGTATDTWTGLGHLEGKEVVILADGKVHKPLTINSGQVTLEYPASTVQIGLSHIPTIELLHPDVVNQQGTSQGVPLTIREAVFRLQDTVGLTVNDYEVPVMTTLSTMDTAPTPFTGDKTVTLVGWKTPQNLKIEQKIPQPFTLLGVVLKVVVGE